MASTGVRRYSAEEFRNGLRRGKWAHEIESPFSGMPLGSFVVAVVVPGPDVDPDPDDDHERSVIYAALVGDSAEGPSSAEFKEFMGVLGGIYCYHLQTAFAVGSCVVIQFSDCGAIEFQLRLARITFGSPAELAAATNAVVVAAPDEIYLAERVRLEAERPCPLCHKRVGFHRFEGPDAFTPYGGTSFSHGHQPVCDDCCGSDTASGHSTPVTMFWSLPRRVELFCGISELSDLYWPLVDPEARCRIIQSRLARRRPPDLTSECLLAAFRRLRPELFRAEVRAWELAWAAAPDELSAQGVLDAAAESLAPDWRAALAADEADACPRFARAG